MTTKELLALVGKWRDEADELTSVLDMMTQEGFIESQAEIELSRKHADELAPIATALCAEVEALRKDAERLNWLDGFTATSGYGIDELFGSGGTRRYVSIRDKDACDDELLGQGPTLRAAIDAAKEPK